MSYQLNLLNPLNSPIRRIRTATGFLAVVASLVCVCSANAGTTWSGGGSDTNIDTAYNWSDSAAPTLTGGTSDLTFGDGGSSATINTTVDVKSVTFNRDADFEIAAGGGSLALTASSTGTSITAANSGVTMRTYAISQDIAINNVVQYWKISNDYSNLSVSGDVTGLNTLVVGSGTDYAGSFALSGNLNLGKLSMNNYANVILSGANTFTNGVQMNNYSKTTFYSGGLGTSGTISARHTTSTAGYLKWAAGNTEDVSGRLVFSATGTSYANFDMNGNAVTFATAIADASASIVGGLSLVASNTGTLTLAAANTYSRGTTVYGGTLRLGADNAIPYGTGKGNLTVQGIFDLNGHNATVNGLVDSVGTGQVVNNAVGTTSTLTAGSSTFTGVIKDGEGVVALAKTGSGTLTLTNKNSYTGGTTIGGGCVVFSKESLGTTGNITVSGGNQVLTWATGNTEDISSRLVVGSSAYAVLNANAQEVTLAGAITGSGGIATNSSCSGTLTLAGANTYSANTSVASTGNTMKLGASNVIPNGTGKGAMKVQSGGIFDMNGYSEVVNGLSSNSISTGGTIKNNAAGTASTLTVGDAESTDTFAGVISSGAGTIALTKIGGGTQTLGGVNTYTGDTTISAGTLLLSSTGSIDNSGKIDVGASSVFDVSAKSGYSLASGQTLAGSGAIVGNVTISDGATLAPGSSIGTLTFDDSLTLSGSTAMQIANSSSADLIAVGGALTLGGTLVVTGEAGTTYAAGDTWNLFDFDAATVSGAFAGYELPKLANSSLAWSTDSLAVNGTISILAVPEPGTIAILSMGLASLAAYAWRKRK